MYSNRGLLYTKPRVQDVCCIVSNRIDINANIFCCKIKVKVKIKVNLEQGHEGPEWE